MKSPIAPSAALIVLVVAGTSPSAQEIVVGKEITPKGSLTIREHPPGIFTPQGDSVGTTAPSQNYIVTEKKEVPSLLGTNTWLKVMPTTDGSNRQGGWVYSGPSSSPNANIILRAQ